MKVVLVLTIFFAIGILFRVFFLEDVAIRHEKAIQLLAKGLMELKQGVEK